MTKLQTSASPAELARIRRFVADEATHGGVDPQVVADLVQAVDESATNIIEHGYRDTGGVVEVEVQVTDLAVTVRLRDRAPRFDPTKATPPDLTGPLETRPLGGMGVQLTRDLMDETRYASPVGWNNELTLLRRLPAHESEG